MKKKDGKEKKSRKKKVKDSISMADLPLHLRSLADIIEKGNMPMSGNINMESITSFKLLFKYNDYRNIVRTRVFFEYPSSLDDKEKTGTADKTVFITKTGKEKKPALKKLKKRMENTIEELTTACCSGALPDPGLVNSFYCDCESLVLHSTGDNTYYEEYLKYARMIADAVRDEDINKAKLALDRLRYVRSESGASLSGGE